METTEVQLVIINHNVAEIVRQFAHYISPVPIVSRVNSFSRALRKGNSIMNYLLIFICHLLPFISCDADAGQRCRPAHQHFTIIIWKKIATVAAETRPVSVMLLFSAHGRLRLRAGEKMAQDVCVPVVTNYVIMLNMVSMHIESSPSYWEQYIA